MIQAAGLIVQTGPRRGVNHCLLTLDLTDDLYTQAISTRQFIFTLSGKSMKELSSENLQKKSTMPPRTTKSSSPQTLIKISGQRAAYQGPEGSPQQSPQDRGTRHRGIKCYDQSL